MKRISWFTLIHFSSLVQTGLSPLNCSPLMSAQSKYANISIHSQNNDLNSKRETKMHCSYNTLENYGNTKNHPNIGQAVPTCTHHALFWYFLKLYLCKYGSLAMDICDAFSHMNKYDFKGKYKLFVGIKIKENPAILMMDTSHI